MAKSLISVFNRSCVLKEVLPFDEYHLIMAQSDFLANMHTLPAIKTYFYRQPPFEGSYIITAGLSAFLSKLDSFSFKQIVPFLEEHNYNKDFIAYIKKRDKLALKLYAISENSIAFPNEPIAIMETNLLDSRILEGLILCEMNFASLVATKWHRIKHAASGCKIMEFGRRRAQNALKASLYSYMVGIDSTSNCEAGNLFSIPVSGTMGHEYVQAFSSELDAFNKWLELNPERPCLLIDTIHTLDSGIQNAVASFKKNRKLLEERGSFSKIAVRIDSGDLAYLAIKAYSTLSTDLGTKEVTIVLSNDLDEYSISAIFSQINLAGYSNIIPHISFGIGTKGAVAWGEPALGGVCKMSEIDGRYILKISNNNGKTTLPGNIRSRLVLDKSLQFASCLIHLVGEDISLEGKYCHPDDVDKFLLAKNYSLTDIRQKLAYVSDGVSSNVAKEFDLPLAEIRKNLASSLDLLDWSYNRVDKPHRAKVSLSENLFSLRRRMILDRLSTLAKS